MEKRAVLAIILSLFVLVGYQYMFAPEAPQVAEKPASVATEAPEKASSPTGETPLPEAVKGRKEVRHPDNKELPGKDISARHAVGRSPPRTNHAHSIGIRGYKFALSI